MNAVETKRFVHSGEINEAAYEKFVAREARKAERAKAAGKWWAKDIEDCRAFAETYCRAYRHQFSVMIEAGADRKPIPGGERLGD